MDIRGKTASSRLWEINCMYLKVMIILVSSSMVLGEELKFYEQWWQDIVEKRPYYCYGLYGLVDAESRILFRNYLKTKQYRNILDIPSGFCVEYAGLLQDHIPIDYYGVDISPYLVNRAQQENICVVKGTIENIPYPDRFFDVCYARHIFEHLSHYEKAVDELIRVARYEVVIIFSLKPWDKEDRTTLLGATLYYNCYNKNKLESLIFSHQQVYGIVWDDINAQEVMLHIYINNK